MSRNLCKDQCCGVKIKLADLVGKPLEFRKYYDYAPTPGVKWQCPECKRFFFVQIRTGHDYWGVDQEHRGRFDKDVLDYPNGQSFKNDQKGKFAKRTTDHKGQEYVADLGYYQLDMSFYESYNDEGDGTDTDDPAYICKKDDERTRWYLT